MATSTTPRLLTLGFAGLGMTTALAGCTAATAGGGDSGSTAEYADGTYTADGDYTAPSGQESITVELTIADDIVTDVVVTPHAESGNQAQFQAQFASGIAAIIEGQDIDSLEVSRVGGSSLTSAGFNAALATIKAEALT